jgi:hypothetical protein
VCFIFVPLHADVKCSECADSLADMAVEHGGTAMDRIDILIVLMGYYKVTEAANVCESTTIFRLNVLLVKA